MRQQGARFEPPWLSTAQRARVYDNTCRAIATRYFDPTFRGTDWVRLARDHRDEVLASAEPEQFEAAVHDVVRRLGTSHTGFFHETARRVPARLAIGVTCVTTETPEGPRWIVRDVHEGGPGHRAGLRPCDVIVCVDGRDAHPPGQLMLPMGMGTTLTITRDGVKETVSIDVPAPRSRKQPYSEPRSVAQSILRDSIGYIKVSILPGLIGIDVARELDVAFEAVSTCDRLILDLRGHMGGGLGVLRLMSHLTPERLPIGYTVTRRSAARGYQKESLPRLDRIPKNKLFGIASMALRYAWRDPSVLLVSEGLGSKRWHGRVAILTNEGTAGAGEMVCAFAKERGLATLVGTETAGRLLPGSGHKVGHGYLVIFPSAAYLTWSGDTYEGRGVEPEVSFPWSVEAYRDGRDNQLEKAVEIVAGL